MGLLTLNPGKASAVGRATSVMVSPICASLTVLIAANTKPTSPTPSSVATVGFGENVPTCSTSNSCPFAISLIFMPGLMTPSSTRVRMMTPRYASYQESKIRALRGASGVARWRRQPLHDRFENLVDAGAFLGAGQNRIAGIEADDVLDLPLRLVGLRARQVDLVDDRDDLEVVLDRQVGVGERLRLDALRRIDEQQRALARGERAGDLVREIDVPRGVNQVEHVDLTVVGLVREPDRVRFDGDPALALEIHAVENLRLHLAGLQGARHLEKTVGQRRLAMVDVGNDGEVADVARIHVLGTGDYSLALGFRALGSRQELSDKSRPVLTRRARFPGALSLKPRAYL